MKTAFPARPPLDGQAHRDGPSLRGRLRVALWRRALGLAEWSVRRGLPPAWAGYRFVAEEDIRAHARREADGARRVEIVHPRARAFNPLPNGLSRDALPDEAGWWGYSMRDVPERISEETFIATVPRARVVSYVDAKNRYFPAFLSHRGTALNLREIKFRHGHSVAIRRARAEGRAPLRLERATWIAERVYDNHSHWLTAHLPKLVLLKERGELGDVILPRELKPAMEESLRMLGLPPERFRRFERGRQLLVDELTVLGTDRFRPELLRPVRAAMAPHMASAPPTRRVYISRARARFRRLRNEDAVWPLLAARGFERVFMEELSFPEQVRLMSETRVLAAPHGAGLTNMMFCPEGAHVVEIASLDFPNPNFYALAAAMGHAYSLVPAAAVGDTPLLEQDLDVAPDKLAAALDRVPALSRAAG